MTGIVCRSPPSCDTGISGGVQMSKADGVGWGVVGVTWIGEGLGHSNVGLGRVGDGSRKRW